MDNRLRVFAILALSIFLISCEKEEELLPGRYITDFVGEADMVSTREADYQYELYYDLSTSSFKGINRRDAWDLALSGDPTKPNIFVNAAMLMAVAPTGTTDFSKNFNPSDYNFEHERPAGFYETGWMHIDFDATGQAKSQVFLIHLGRDLQNQLQGYLKFQILSHENGRYQCQWSELDGRNLQSFDLQTSSLYNYQFVSFENPKDLLNLEPPKTEWDLRFCKYMEQLASGQDTLDYSVTGVLLNPYKTMACLDTLLSSDSTVVFNQLKIEDFDLSLLNSKTNTLGHDWKYFNLDNEAFGIHQRRIYLVKDEQGQHYRFRFTGFYSATGTKGAVNFQFLPI